MKTTTIELSSILSTIQSNQGHMPTHELAMMLNKRHSNLLRKLEEQGVCLLNLSTHKIDVPMPNGGMKTTDSYLLDERQAVALAMSYDMNLGMLVWDGFKAALEVVDAVNAGETPEEIQRKAEDVAYKHLASSIMCFVCPQTALKNKATKELFKMIIKMASVACGGVHASLSNIGVFYQKFAVQASLHGLPLRHHWQEQATLIINPAFGLTLQAEHAKIKHDAVFSSWV
ncbi:MAG: hypothetical protein ACRC53_01350 [Plesiomonas sp.]|uniref:hypothetical protein n=1 Tax=Plesiomonas sp. TaxID=2486279 RepID=UPI003F3BAF3A